MVADKQSRFQEAISRPVKLFGGIAGMQGFVITLSGYSSRTTPTREDIQIAIHATGACMLPVLSRTHSTHLLCFEPSGEKYKKAQSWRFENIVSHQVCCAALLEPKRGVVVHFDMFPSLFFSRSGCLTVFRSGSTSRRMHSATIYRRLQIQIDKRKSQQLHMRHRLVLLATWERTKRKLQRHLHRPPQIQKAYNKEGDALTSTTS